MMNDLTMNKSSVDVTKFMFQTSTTNIIHSVKKKIINKIMYEICLLEDIQHEFSIFNRNEF